MVSVSGQPNYLDLPLTFFSLGFFRFAEADALRVADSHAFCDTALDFLESGVRHVSPVLEFTKLFFNNLGENEPQG